MTKSAASASSEFEATVIFRSAIAEELRQRNHLHPMFYLPVEWDEKVSGHFAGGDPARLSEADFFNSQRIKACEAKYFQYLGKHLTKILLVEKDDYNCKVVRHLLTELLANCVLYPVCGLFTPLVVNQWVDYALTPAAASTGPGEGLSDRSLTSMPQKDPVEMMDYSPPPGFTSDRFWAYFKAGVREKDICKKLLTQNSGSYLIISLNDNDLFCLLSVYEDTGSPGEKGLYHVPFVGYTTDPAGFQICMLSSEEYFPVSVGPPPSIELLNGSMFITLEQLVVALSSIASTGVCLNDAEATTISAEDGRGSGNISIPESGNGSDEVDEVAERVLSHVEPPADDKELFMEQERLVLLYELQGAVEEFRDAIRFHQSQKKTGSGFSSWSAASKGAALEQQTVNMCGDKSAIRSLKRFILCLEDVIFHGFSVNTEDLNSNAAVISSLLDGEKAVQAPNNIDSPTAPVTPKKSSFSLKTIVKRAMSTKKNSDLPVENHPPDGSEISDSFRRPSLKTSNEILGMLNLLDKRYPFNWFWLEMLRSSTLSVAEKGDGGIVSSASAKLRRLSNTRKEDPSIPVVQRLYSSWIDLFSNRLLLSIEDCQQEVVSVADSYRYSSAVDKNCLRVFLYDSLVNGKLVERIGRIVCIATRQTLVGTDIKEGEEYIIPSFYMSDISRGHWSPHAVLMNTSDIAKLLSSLAPLTGCSVSLSQQTALESTSEVSDEASSGAGLMSFINTASLLGVFSGKEDGDDSDHAAKKKMREEKSGFTRRLRSRRLSVDHAWSQMSFKEMEACDTPGVARGESSAIKKGNSSRVTVGNIFGNVSQALAVAPSAAAVAVEPDIDDDQDSVYSVEALEHSEGNDGGLTPTRRQGSNNITHTPLRGVSKRKIRSQEVIFRLEMLLSGRPTLQALEELGIWKPVSKSVDVQISKAELEDDPTAITIAGSSMKQIVVYSLTVTCKNTYVERNAFNEEREDDCEGAQTWTVRK